VSVFVLSLPHPPSSRFQVGVGLFQFATDGEGDGRRRTRTRSLFLRTTSATDRMARWASNVSDPARAPSSPAS